MIELGKIQELEVLREKEFGVYLGEKQDAEASVLLPKKQVPEGTKTGDTIRVSKPELHAVIAVNTDSDSLIICNGDIYQRRDDVGHSVKGIIR